METNDEHTSAFDKLASDILKSETNGRWLCPSCHIPLSVRFEAYGEGKTGLRVTCPRCLTQCNMDGTFQVPQWYLEYQQPSPSIQMPKRAAARRNGRKNVEAGGKPAGARESGVSNLPS